MAAYRHNEGTAMLTPSAVANAKPRAKPYKLADERGMFLLVQPRRFALVALQIPPPGTHKENCCRSAPFPTFRLKQARERRDEARKLLADGIDPGDKRKAESAAGADTSKPWRANGSPSIPRNGQPTTPKRNIRRLERDVFPWIGSKPLASVTAPDILAVLERIDARGARETAHRARTNIGQVIRFGIATGRTNFDPTVALRGAIPPATERNHAAVTEPDKVGELLRAIDAYAGHFPTRCALQLAPLFFVRPGELRQAEWAEMDLDAAEWNLPAHKMKMRQPHIVPLATQAVAILRALYPLTGSGRYVFPGGRTPKRPMSNNATNAALRRMGFDKDTMTAHGFRAMARTILDEGWASAPTTSNTSSRTRCAIRTGAPTTAPRTCPNAAR